MASLGRVTHGGAADAADDAEDCAEAVVDAVDGIADPTARLLAALGALGQHLIENRLGADLVHAGGRWVVAAQQRAQLLVVLLLVLDDVFEDGDGFRVAQAFELLAITSYCPAFLDLQAPEGHADAAGAAGQRIGLAAGLAVVDRLGSAQLHNASVPQFGVLPLGAGQMAQHLGAHRVGIPLGHGQIGVVALHLGLPIAFQRCQNLLQLGAAQCFPGHSFLLAFH